MSSAKTFGITGSPNTTYDMDKLKEDSRLNSKEALVVQVWKYNPKSTNPEKRAPNPPNLVMGQIWLSRKDSDL